MRALACVAYGFALGVSLTACAAPRELRVCADPDNLPYSNRAEQGFENRIATLVAHELGDEIRYYWLPQWRGYARKTLQQHRCDLIPGIAQAKEESSGMKARPCSPAPPMIRSIRKAARAM